MCNGASSARLDHLVKNRIVIGTAGDRHSDRQRQTNYSDANDHLTALHSARDSAPIGQQVKG
jgi:hypothetical protein